MKTIHLRAFGDANKYRGLCSTLCSDVSRIRNEFSDSFIQDQLSTRELTILRLQFVAAYLT